MIDLNQFYKWQQEKERRSVDITIGEPSDHGYIKIWVYDFSLSVGQHVTSVDEIDLEKEKEHEEKEEYERLKRKFEEGQ